MANNRYKDFLSEMERKLNALRQFAMGRNPAISPRHLIGRGGKSGFFTRAGAIAGERDAAMLIDFY